jgi:hypothetical protein
MPTPDLPNRVEHAASNPLIEKLARTGYAVKGLVYGLVGFLALRAALGAGGETTDAQGAISAIGDEPFGEALLWLVAVGLAGYSLWRFIQALGDPDHEGSDAEGLVKRVGYAGSGAIYAGLAYSTLRLVTGNGDGGNGASSWTAMLMEQPLGPWLVGAAGLVTIGIGVYQFVRAYRASFFDRFRKGSMSAAERTWTRRLGRFGLAARGVVFGIIGAFLLQAAFRANPGEARGIGGALDALAAQPYGPYLLGAVSLGFVSYGVYCGLQARYRRIGERPA